MAYEPLFNTTKNVGVGPGLTMNVKVPSRINREYTDATQQAYNIGNIAATTGITSPTALVNLSQNPGAADIMRGMNLMRTVAQKLKQGLKNKDYLLIIDML